MLSSNPVGPNDVSRWQPYPPPASIAPTERREPVLGSLPSRVDSASTPGRRRLFTRPGVLAAWSALSVFLGMLVGAVTTEGITRAFVALGTIIALGGVGLGVVDLFRRPATESRVRHVVKTAAILVTNLAMVGFGALMAYLSTVEFSRGRQLRRFGRVLLPRLGPNPAWATLGVTVEDPGTIPAGLADRWRENAKTEHASVAAFARLILDLMALGAPPDLVAAAHADSLDEIRHTELCLSLARALDGREEGPLPFPEAQRVSTLPRVRSLALAKLAVDSLIDGALHEGVSARILGRLAHRCEVPEIQAVLKEIAADEGRHAAHGWDVVAWCVAAGGRPVEQALRGAIRTLPAAMTTELPAQAGDGVWERWGIHGHALEAEEYAATRQRLIERVERLTQEPTQAA